MVVAPFVYDALHAKIAEAAGFEAIYMTGFGTAAARGFPDLGLITLAEMAQNVRSVARSVEIPVVCDADTGYGNPLNVIRTIEEYEHAGAAALHLEDQVFPKRCGAMQGKQVIPLEDMVHKVRAALDARSDPDLVIIARTDALQPEGWGSVEERGRTYHEAGADLIFVDGIHTLQELDTYAERLADLPRLYNGQLLPVAEVEKRGFRLMIHSATFMTVYKSVRDAMRELKRTGRVEKAAEPGLLDEMMELLGIEKTLEVARRYGA
jgi:2-methylisocitrate lyase-like PEP mutase family enzyme